MADFPSSPRPAEVVWHLRYNTRIFKSPFTGSIMTSEIPGALWVATLTFIDFTRAELEDIEAFMDSLRGSSGRFDLWHHGRESPRGTGLGTPLVDGASQTGASITTDNWSINQTGALLKSDMFEVNGELKRVIQQVDADGLGDATIVFEPPLRNSPPDNDPIVLTTPKARMMLSDDSQGAIRSYRTLNSFSLSCIEAPTP